MKFDMVSKTMKFTKFWLEKMKYTWISKKAPEDQME